VAANFGLKACSCRSTLLETLALQDIAHGPGHATRDLPLLKFQKGTIMAPLTTWNPGNVG
jgi:hypothetical protein